MKKSLQFLIILAITMFSLNVMGQTKISAIQAKLFYNEKKDKQTNSDVSGNFSENIIDNSEITLWNTIIGEGSAEGYSDQTIVIVEVTSIGQSNKDQILKLSASAGKKILLQQQRTFSCIGENTKYKLLFLLNDTGCDKITLKAEILKNGKNVSTMNKTINFECGE